VKERAVVKTYGHEGLMMLVPACVLVFFVALVVGGPGELLDMLEKTLVALANAVGEYVARVLG
jgi:hypothetical protein